MPVIMRMPSVLADTTHAVLATWLIEPGASVAVGDAVAEIETDKAVVEYAAEVEGTVGRLLVEAGADVAVGDPIAVVLAEGEAPSSATEDEVDLSAAVSDAPAAAEPSAPDAAAETARTAAPPASAKSTGTESTGRILASPIARRAAKERGVDLGSVTGTGPGGRVVRRDVEAHEPPADATPPGDPAPDTTPPSAPAPATTSGEFTDIPLNGMRRAIARRLTESKSTVPHFYLNLEVRVDKLLALRADVNQVASRKVSVNDLVVKAVAAALVEVPAANAIWMGDSIRRFANADVGVAMAVEGGLVTPVLRAANTLGIAELSAQLGELAERARSGRLRQHELEGGSFTVSNLGMYGVDQFAAIINPPQSGILAVSAAKRQPVVGDDGQLAVATVMTATLSADHRVIDGAVAAELSAALRTKLEDAMAVLL